MKKGNRTPAKSAREEVELLLKVQNEFILKQIDASEAVVHARLASAVALQHRNQIAYKKASGKPLKIEYLED